MSHTFNELKKAGRKIESGDKSLRIALLSDTPSQWLAQAVKGWLSIRGINSEIWEAGIGQLELQTFDSASELFSRSTHYALVHTDAREIHKRFYKTAIEHRVAFADEYFREYRKSLEAIASKGIRVIVYNWPLLNDGVMGQYANKAPQSYLFQMHRLNMLLMEWCSEQPNTWIADLVDLYSRKGAEHVFAPNLWATTGLVHSIDALPLVARCAADIIVACEGMFKKCLILDLDDTLWGGTVGDDGWESLQLGSLGLGKAFTEIQRWSKALKERGVIICVCSKNDERIARNVFERHPDMILKVEDIAVFAVNWDHKPDNIRFIQQTLNIGFESMVFVDNSKFEREMVRAALPHVTVPELPEDAAEFVSFLQSLNLFEVASLSEDDIERTKRYREEAQRTAVLDVADDPVSFLKKLELVASIEPFTSFNLPRVAQLTQRSNQFNLRTQRYDEAQLNTLQNDDRYECFAFSLKDKFGDYGLVGVAILHYVNDGCFLDTLLMSCRVLNRGMEEFIFNTLAEHAKSHGASYLTAEYLPTSKNGLVEGLLARMGFVTRNKFWVLDLLEFKPRQTFVTRD